MIDHASSLESITFIESEDEGFDDFEIAIGAGGDDVIAADIDGETERCQGGFVGSVAELGGGVAAGLAGDERAEGFDEGSCITVFDREDLDFGDHAGRIEFFDESGDECEVLGLGADDEGIVAIVDGNLGVFEKTGGGEWVPVFIEEFHGDAVPVGAGSTLDGLLEGLGDIGGEAMFDGEDASGLFGGALGDIELID